MKKLIFFASLITFSLIGIQESFAEDFQYDLGKMNYWNSPDIDSPKTQFENGIESREIICRNGLYLLYKVSDGSPVCVNEYLSAPKLIERGWATLGETSLVISTDKETYSPGEEITIVMKNEGDTMLIFSGHADFQIMDSSGNYISLPLDTVVPPVDRLWSFDTMASTSFVWNQTNNLLIPVKSGVYYITAKYSYPIPDSQNSQLSYQGSETVTTFEIISDGSFEQCVEEGNKVTKSIPRQCVTSDGKHYTEYIGIVTLETNKENYRIDESIKITMKNVGTDDVFYPSVPIGFWVFDKNDEIVFNTQGPFEAVGILQPGESVSHLWNQKIQHTDTQVESGIFTVTTQWDAIQTTQSTFTIENCLFGYPDICIPYSPTDLNCDDIEHRNFEVLAGYDTHNFDADSDNVGCETD